ncbi:MAG: ArsR/SmtB family transcription factor [Candidatus Sigynarchaeota archaeon]
MSGNEEEDDWFFDILGNDVRRKIIQMLSRGPTSMKQFTDAVNVSRQAILKQLEQMQVKGLVESHDMELDGDEKRKGPPARVYNLTKFFKIEYEVNPSFTEPLVTRLYLLPGEINKTKLDDEELKKKYPTDIRECFKDLAQIDSNIQELQNKHRELYQKKVELLNRLRSRIDQSFDEKEEKEILLYMLAHPARSLEGMRVSELASVVPLRRDFLDAVLTSLQKHGYIERKGEMVRIKAKNE